MSEDPTSAAASIIRDVSEPVQEHTAELDVSWGRATLVWWALAWRSFGIAVLLGAGIGCVIGFVVGFLGHLVGADPFRVQWVIRLLSVPAGLVIGALVGVGATRAVLRKRFREFRIVLIAR